MPMTPDTEPASVDSPLPPTSLPMDAWQPLPARGARLAALGGAIGFAVVFTPACWILLKTSDAYSPWWAALAALPLAAFGAIWAARRHRRIAWRLGSDGFAVRRGNWWRSETHLPISRVQHLDLKRGPLERLSRLATLVVHTAGTRMAAVSVPGLDEGDAERLRDQLARQLDDDAL